MISRIHSKFLTGMTSYFPILFHVYSHLNQTKTVKYHQKLVGRLQERKRQYLYSGQYMDVILITINNIVTDNIVMGHTSTTASFK